MAQYPGSFLKVAATLVDLWFIELMLNRSQLKQVYSHQIYGTHELILCIEITRRWVDINKDSTVKSPCWHRVLSLRPSDPDILPFCSCTILTGFGQVFQGRKICRKAKEKCQGVDLPLEDKARLAYICKCIQLKESQRVGGSYCPLLFQQLSGSTSSTILWLDKNFMLCLKALGNFGLLLKT